MNKYLCAVTITSIGLASISWADTQLEKVDNPLVEKNVKLLPAGPEKVLTEKHAVDLNTALRLDSQALAEPEPAEQSAQPAKPKTPQQQETFKPSETISEDLSVSFPIDI